MTISNLSLKNIYHPEVLSISE